MLKGFKEFLSQGNIVDLAVAVVIGTAFTALVKSFTDAIIEPLIASIGVKPDAKYGILSIDIGGPKPIDLNILLSAGIYFILVALVVYFFVVLPYNTLRKKGEVEQADDAQIVLLTEIRDLLSQTQAGASSGRHGGQGAFERAPVPEVGPRAEAENQIRGTELT